MNMKAYVVASGKGVYLGELRVFKQYNDLVNYGYMTRFYETKDFPDSFTALHQEVHVSPGGILFLDKDDTSSSK